MANKPCCIDLYHGDNVSDNPTSLAGLDQIKRTGVFACIHKSSEGTALTDSRYDARRAKWMSGNPVAVVDIDGSKLSLAPVWGAYHFFYGANPATEARFFLQTARLKPTDMPFIDWEAVGASGHQPSLEAADTFCSAVEAALGRPCGVYGGNVPRERFQAEKASSAVLERFAIRPLWFCGYGAYSAEKLKELIPEPWQNTGIWLWQDDGDKSGPGPHVMPGISGYCDNSTVVAPMTFARLHSQWISVAAPQPSPVVAPPAPEAIPVPPAPLAPVAPPEAAPKPVPETAKVPSPKETLLERLKEEAPSGRD